MDSSQFGRTLKGKIMPLSQRDLRLLESAFSHNDHLVGMWMMADRFPHMSTMFHDHNIRARDVFDEFAKHPEVKSSFIRCERCTTPMRNNNFMAVRSVEDESALRWCTDCGANYAHYWSDGSYRNARQPTLEDFGVGGYHGSRHRDEMMHNVDYSNPRLLGLEIETNVKKFQAIADVLNVGWVAAERDGSLDPVGGVEFVFRPLPLDEIVEGGNICKIANILRDAGTRAWSDDRCGMHISINTHKMSHLQAGKICRFINGHESLCTLVSGRREVTYAKYGARVLSQEGMQSDHEKYRAASRRGRSRLEIRIFRSSVNFGRIRQNCEFADSVREFCIQSSNKELTSYAYMDFLKRYENHARYKLIRKFLGLLPEKKVFPQYQVGNVKGAMELELV